MKSVIHTIVFIFVLFSFRNAPGQSLPGKMQVFTLKDGLNSNHVSDIILDHRGFLWVTTSAGLSRFDGSEFVEVQLDDKNSLHTEHAVNRIIETRDHKLLIGTNRGLIVLHPETGKQKRIFFDYKKMSSIDSVWSTYLNAISILEQDGAGNIWVGTPVCAYRLDASFRVKRIFWSGYRPEDIPKKRLDYVRKILPLKDSTVFIWLHDRLFVWEAKPNHSGPLTPIEKWKNGRYTFLKYGSAHHFFSSPKGNLLFLEREPRKLHLINLQSGDATNCTMLFSDEEVNWQQQLSVIDSNHMAFAFETFGFSLIKINEQPGAFSIAYQPERYFTGKTFRKMLADEDRNIWATSLHGGLQKISAQRDIFQQTRLPDFSDSSKTKFPVSCFLRVGNKMYVGTDGDGIYEWNQTTNRFVQHLNKSFSKTRWNNTIWNFRKGKADTIWVGTQNGLFWFHTRLKKFGRMTQPHPDELDSVAITTQFTDSKGLVWMGLGLGKGMAVYNPSKSAFTLHRAGKNGYPFRYPIAIAEDSKSNLWFVSDNTPNLVMLNRRQHRFEVVEIQTEAKKAWTAVHIDSMDRLWFGVEGVGLHCYDIRHKRPVYVVRNKFASDYDTRLASAGNNGLWITSSNGLTYYNPATGGYTHYTKGATEWMVTFNSRFYFDSASGLLYTAFYRDIIAFDPQTGSTPKKPLPIYITQVKIKDDIAGLSANRSLRLKHQQNEISVSFTGINLDNGSENRYAYRLNKNKWVDLGNQKLLRLANLAPGEYDLWIRGARNDENWSEKMEHLHLSIAASFTGTPWFYLLTTVVLFSLVYGWYRYRLNQILKLQKLRTEISGNLHDELGSKLTSLSYMALLAQKKAAAKESIQEILEKINDNSMKASASLREIVWGINPEIETLNKLIPRMVQQMAEMLELRNIDFFSDTPVIPGKVRLAFDARKDFEMIMAEATNNIIKHSAATRVWLYMRFERKHLLLVLEDNGRGMERKEKPDGMGLANIKSRARRHNWTVQFSHRAGGGCRMEMSLKI